MPTAVVSYGFRGDGQRPAGARGRALQGPRGPARTTRSRDPLPLRLPVRRAGAASMSASTDSESLRHYLELSGRRGEPLAGGLDGAAGGAAVRRPDPNLADRGGRADRADELRRRGLRHRPRRRGRDRCARRGRDRARGGARSARRRSPPSSAGSARRGATRSSSPPTRCTARSPGSPAPVEPLADRRDDRRAGAGRAQRRRRLGGRRPARARARGGGGRGDAEAVGRPAHRRGEELLLAARRARRPRGSRTGSGSRT